jgi:alanine-synthesizing transaminase
MLKCVKFRILTGGQEMSERTFNKSSKLDNVLYDVRGPVVEEANRMQANGIDVLKLNIGNPAPFGFNAPEEVILDMAANLRESQGYSDSKGIWAGRKAIMQYAQSLNIPNVSMDDIYTGNGVSELINLCMQALLDNGDEILIPAPDYPLWTACANLAGGKAVHYLCDEQSDWNPDLEDMESKITDKTKAIVIINPNNPTGAVYPKEILEKIVEIARRHQLIIFSDEIYDRLLMDGYKHTSIASLAPDLFCVTFSGLSKSHMIAGFRVGWMILSGNKEIARDYMEGLKMLSSMRLCSNVPAQSIIQTSLGGHQSVNDYVCPTGRVTQQRDFIIKALGEIPGVSVVKPKAAFYCFPKLDTERFGIHDDMQFAYDLLKQEHVLIVQGTGFNWPSPDHFRIVYLPRLEILEEAAGKLKHFLSSYHQE